MSVSTAVAGLLLGCVFARSSAAQDQTQAPDVEAQGDSSTVETRELPKIALKSTEPASPAQIARIKECIAQLREIDKPDYGLSPTMNGSAFLPLPSQRRAGAMLVTNHELQSSEALKSLVEIGPAALPFLLDALEDPTPTKLRLEHSGCFGGMFLAAELDGNPANERESRVLKVEDAPEFFGGKSLEEYVVKTGDVCLVAIGQIVGRNYQAVHYQFTAITVVNSPVEDASMRGRIRTLWASDDPARAIFDSLCRDYATQGAGWNIGSRFRTQAAMRLLYYFPVESERLIADRLRNLDVGKTSERGAGLPTRWRDFDVQHRRDLANGVGTAEFIKSVSWCKRASIAKEIEALFSRADDIDFLLAALPGVENTRLITARLQSFLDALPANDDGPYGVGYDLLSAAAVTLGKDALPLFKEYLRDGSPRRGYTASQALTNVRGEPLISLLFQGPEPAESRLASPPIEWANPIFFGLLADQRSIDGDTFEYGEQDNLRRLPLRVCDAAAEAFQRRHPELNLTIKGDYAERDAQIDAIRASLGDTK